MCDRHRVQLVLLPLLPSPPSQVLVEFLCNGLGLRRNAFRLDARALCMLACTVLCSVPPEDAGLLQL